MCFLPLELGGWRCQYLTLSSQQSCYRVLTHFFRNLRKIEILLNEFERAGKDVEYFALDLSLEELERTLCQIPTKSYVHVKCRGLQGTYDDALAWLRTPENRQKPTWILSLGSSIGNFNHEDAAQFLAGFAQILGPSDSMLIGLDACKDSDKVFKAYNDREGVTNQFYMNGLARANSILGFEAFRAEDWDAIGTYDEVNGCHQAFYSPKRDVEVNGVTLKEGERILFEQSFKYGYQESSDLWHEAGLNPISVFGNSTDEYRKFFVISGFQKACFGCCRNSNWIFC